MEKLGRRVSRHRHGRLTDKIETWGRGIRKVFDECARHGCPPPAYEVNAGDPGDPGDIHVRYAIIYHGS